MYSGAVSGMHANYSNSSIPPRRASNAAMFKSDARRPRLWPGSNSRKCMHADANAVAAAAAFLTALSGYNGVGGVALATSDLASPPSGAGPGGDAGAMALARLAAAAHVLAPGAAYIARLDAVPTAATLRLAAVAGAAFANVQLLRPVATRANDGHTWLLATHRRHLHTEERAALLSLGGLNHEAVLQAGVTVDGEEMRDGGGEDLPVPEALQESFEKACEWEAARAEADLAALELIYEGGEAAQQLAKVGQRWGAFIALDGLTVETRDPQSVRTARCRHRIRTVSCSAAVSAAPSSAA